MAEAACWEQLACQPQPAKALPGQQVAEAACWETYERRHRAAPKTSGGACERRKAPSLHSSQLSTGAARQINNLHHAAPRRSSNGQVMRTRTLPTAILPLIQEGSACGGNGPLDTGLTCHPARPRQSLLIVWHFLWPSLPRHCLTTRSQRQPAGHPHFSPPRLHKACLPQTGGGSLLGSTPSWLIVTAQRPSLQRHCLAIEWRRQPAG